MDLMIYLICLGVGFLFTVISATLGHVFGHSGHLDGSGGHAETGADMSDGAGISAFSPTIISSFVTAFGAFGVLLHQFPPTRNPMISATLSLIGAFAIAGVLFAFLKQVFRKTQSSSEAKVASLAGTLATTVSSIPAEGVGEIAYVQGGTRYTAPAREEQGRQVAPGRSVRITRVIGTQYYVEAV